MEPPFLDRTSRDSRRFFKSRNRPREVGGDHNKLVAEYNEMFFASAAMSATPSGDPLRTSSALASDHRPLEIPLIDSREIVESISRSQLNDILARSKMSSSVGAPQTHGQRSRKGKKAWRKNVDVSEIQEGLENAREEVIKGSV